MEEGNVTRIDSSVARYAVVAEKEDPWPPRQRVSKSANSCTAATVEIEGMQNRKPSARYERAKSGAKVRVKART